MDRGLIVLLAFVTLPPLALTCPLWLDRLAVWFMREFNVYLYPDAIRLAISLQQNTDSWRFDEHWASHNTIGKIWIANGASYIRLKMPSGNDTIEWKPGWIERRIIYNAQKQACAKAIHQKLDKVLPSL